MTASSPPADPVELAEDAAPATAAPVGGASVRRNRLRRDPAAAPLRLMLLLTFGTGLLDAATYLGLHGVFTANMTGNVVFIGVGLAGHEPVPLLRSALALGGFVAGAAVIGRLQRGKAVIRDGDPVVALTFCVVALTMVLLALALAFVDLSAVALDVLTAVFAMAMGAQAIAARRVDVPDVSTVVVTSTLSGLAADHGWAGGTADRSTTRRRLSAVVSMGLGALAGAFLLHWHLAAPVGLSALILTFVALASLVRWRRQRRSRSAAPVSGG